MRSVQDLAAGQALRTGSGCFPGQTLLCLVTVSPPPQDTAQKVTFSLLGSELCFTLVHPHLPPLRHRPCQGRPGRAQTAAWSASSWTCVRCSQGSPGGQRGAAASWRERPVFSGQESPGQFDPEIYFSPCVFQSLDPHDLSSVSPCSLHGGCPLANNRDRDVLVENDTH